MKKFLAIIAIAGVFTACGESSQKTEAATDSSTMMGAPMDSTSSMMSGDSSNMMAPVDSMPKK